jgi:hypothetical protein
MEFVAGWALKQRVVIEFFVHENESVVNIHKRLCAMYGVLQSIGALLGGGLRELNCQEVQNRAPCCHYSCGVAHHNTTIASTALDKHWKCVQLLRLSDIRKSAQSGFHEILQQTTRSRGKPFLLNCWSVLMLRERLFVPDCYW